MPVRAAIIAPSPVCQVAADRASEKILLVALVIDGLAVTADQRDAGLSFGRGLHHGFGVKFAEQYVQSRQVGHLRFGVHHRQDELTDVLRIGKFFMRDEV